MRKLVKWAAITFAGLLILGIGIGIGSGDNTNTGKPAKTPSRGDQAAANAIKDDDGDGVLNPYDPDPNDATVSSYEEETPTPEPAPEPDPKGSSELNCDYTLGDFGDSGDPAQGYRFIAGGTLENTGNIGIVARVRFTWEQLGQAPVVAQRIVRLPIGKSKRVSVTVPATQDQIDLHQSSHGDCKSRVKITDTFGQPKP